MSPGTHRRRRQTALSELPSDDEMDRRIHELAGRVGIGRGAMVVRHVTPAAGADEREAAEAAVLGVLASGRPMVIGFIAHETSLPRSTVANALAALAAQGHVVSPGTKRQADGGPQRLWELAP